MYNSQLQARMEFGPSFVKLKGAASGPDRMSTFGAQFHQVGQKFE